MHVPSFTGGLAGYSGTPLAQKLGIGSGHVVALLDEPDQLRDLLEPVPDGVTFRASLRGRVDLVVGFFTRRTDLGRRLPAMARAVHPSGGIWVGWPKKASRVPTDITENTVRELALPMGLVDNKVCAIDDTWSGLRVVHRKENR